MRILTRPNVGGPTLQAASLFAEHAALGVQTLLVVGRCRDDEAAVDLQALGVPRLAAAAITPAAAGYVEIPELGKRWSLRGDAAAGRQLRALLREFTPDVVHTHTSKAGYCGRRAARATAVPVVAHTFHGHVLRDYFGRLPSWLLTRLETRLARCSDLLFAVSPSCADELAELGVAARERLRVVAPAVPLPLFATRRDARQQLGLAADAWAVACIGRLVPIKRVDRFVEAVASLPGCIGHVHGDGPLGRDLTAAAAATNRVHLLGSSSAARRLLPAYDALVIPSAREGCPLVAVEAFAAGVPVVGFDVPGVRDVLGPWGGGLLVPPAHGGRGLAMGLQRLHVDAALRHGAMAAGRAGLARFAPATVAKALSDAYREALHARCGYAPYTR